MHITSEVQDIPEAYIQSILYKTILYYYIYVVVGFTTTYAISVYHH